jgi:hypothetical protein
MEIIKGTVQAASNFKGESMTPERAEQMRIARETLFSDETSSRIFSHMLALHMNAAGQGFVLEDALKDPLWLMKESLVKAFNEHKSRYVELLKQALPDFSIRERVKPVIVDESENIRVYDSLEQLPEKARVVAKQRNDGKFQLTVKDYLAATGDGEMPKDDPGKPLPKDDLPPFCIRSSEVSAPGGMAAYAALREKALTANTSVRVVD